MDNVANEDFGIPVHCFERGRRKKICIHVQEYMGSTFLSIREFYQDRNDESWKPSRRGITVPPDLYLELLQGIVAAAEPLGVDVPDDLGSD